MGELIDFKVSHGKHPDWQRFYSLGRSFRDYLKTLNLSEDNIPGVYIYKNVDTYCIDLTYDGVKLKDTPLDIKNLSTSADVTLDWKTCEQDISLVEEQIRLLVDLAREQKLDVTFFEISLFDPKDKHGSDFYTFLYASDKRVINFYRNEMRKNLHRESNRGPIIPNLYLYQSAIILLKEDNPVSCRSLGEGQDILFCGCYRLEEETSEPPETLNGYIRVFFSETIKHFEYQGGDGLLDTALIIPLLRPAGNITKFSLQESATSIIPESRYRGGGLILYGKRVDAFDHKEFALFFNHQLALATMDVTFTQVDMEAVDRQAKETHLETEFNKERAYAHLAKRLYARMAQYLERRDEMSRNLTRIISDYLSLSFEWRQSTFSSIEPEQNLFIDFAAFIESLLIQMLCVYDPDVCISVELGPLQTYISECVNQLKGRHLGVGQNDINKLILAQQSRQEFFECNKFMRLKKMSDVSVEVNVSRSKSLLFTLMSTFSEFLFNAINNNKFSDKELILYVNRSAEESMLIFSERELSMTSLDKTRFRKPSESLSEPDLRQGFGLRSLEYYFGRHKCTFKFFRDLDNNFVRAIIFKEPDQNLFLLKSEAR